MLHHYGNNHDHGAGTSFFSLLFPLSGRSSTSTYDHNASPANYVDNAAVDCTLSLATPSTRHACSHTTTTSCRTRTKPQITASCASTTNGSVSNWDNNVVSTDQSNSNSDAYTSTSARHFNKSAGGSSTKEADASARLSQRRCANCDTTSTPLWRNGPRGPKSLCNACGIRYKKEERRAAAAAAVSPVLDCTSGYVSGYSYQNQSTSHQQQQSWGCYASTVGKGSGFTSYGDDTSESRDLPYMPWQLNIVQPQPFPVVDRTGLYQYN